ncbi:MAG TPA: malectin [Roseiflexaceae bacterium]
MFKYSLRRRMAALISLSLALATVLVATAAGAPRARTAPPAQGVAVDIPTYLPLALKYTPPVRIDSAATTSYTDSNGNVWQADTGFVDGTAGNHGNISISNTSDPQIYRTERYNLTGYAIPVTNGDYTVRLHFAENFYTGAGKRIFNVSVEGTPINNLDVFAEAGGVHVALVKTVNVTVADGKLDLGFTASVGETMIDGIEAIPQ